MSPHETLFLEATAVCDVNKTLSNRLTQFQTWDFGGDLCLSTDIEYMNHPISFDTIFKMSNTLVYVIDAQEDDYEDSLPKLAETISNAHKSNPNMNFEVFLHKVDGDFMSEETKSERKQVTPPHSTCATDPSTGHPILHLLRAVREREWRCSCQLLPHFDL
jgi:Ras-related GTP-binding protein C/D